jgi:homoserine O-acetyltransferase
MMAEENILDFCLGDQLLVSGKILKNVVLRYVTLGAINDEKSNVILYPTHYGGTHKSNVPMIGPGRALDPSQYFIIIPNMIGNGESTSPSNYETPSEFPNVTVYDNIQFQHKLVQSLQINSLAMVIGFSMGAQQAFQWAVSFPKMVQRVVAICGSAKTSIHNYVFLEGVKSTVIADGDWNDGKYTEQPKRGLKSFGRVYAGWAYSQTFFRNQLFKNLGFETVEDLLVFWQEDSMASDANDLLSMIWTWQNHDVSAHDGFNGNLELALSSLKMPVWILPGSTDLYFQSLDSQIESQMIPNSRFCEIKSDYGHMAGGPNNKIKEVTLFMDQIIREALLQ